MEQFGIKRATFKIEKDKEGKDVKVKTGETAIVKLPLPEFCSTVAGFKKVFAKLPDVNKLADDHFCAGETVKLQAYLRIKVEPKDWNAANLAAAIKEYTPQKQSRGKSAEEKMAEKYNMDPAAFAALLAKHAGK